MTIIAAAEEPLTMSFFEKFKKHSAPPAPPKRIENNTSYGWPDDEFDEDGDTYEAPPCERPAVKVPTRPPEENVYLDGGFSGRSSNPVVPMRQAAPPPRPTKSKAAKPMSPPADPEDFYVDPNVKPPEIDRKEKPGKKPAMPRPARPPPVASPPEEDDVYLDPNEGQGDGDDLYLEPAAATPPPPREPAWKPSPPKAAAPPPSRREPPPTLMKPPVPRSSTLPHMDIRAIPPPEVRRSSFPSKMPPPTPVSKPPLPNALKEAKPCPPPPPMIDSIGQAPLPSPQGGSASENEENREWFAGNCDRKTAEDLLHRISKDGAFLVRRSSAQNARQPYTLVVLYRQKVYNIPVRYIEETQGYALGKEGKKNDEVFSSLQEIIFHHQNNPLLLIDSKSQAKHTTYLTQAARK
ncbi:B-cell linker protein [Engraulis encrasicolus]|uniref:B-cell linker protein n=1 Tax=Engraulis encrasicolus TaxID=184585 RepID=UPI002FCFE6D5